MNTDLRKEWYNRVDVQINLMPLLRARETAFLVPMSLRKEKGNYPVRCIKAHASSYLLNNMRAFDFFNREYNLYASIYLINGMPMFSYAPMQRTEQQHKFFKEYDTFVEGVDFVMDFDGDKKLPLELRLRNAQEQTILITRLLRVYDIPYVVIFSGSKGFHIEIRNFPATQKWNKQAIAFEQVAIRLVLQANGHSPQLAEKQESIDSLREMLTARYSFDSSIYNVTRIWKVPYSYDVTTDSIVMPLSDEELINFKVEDYHVTNMLKINHTGKGLKTRKGKIENFWILAKALGVDYANG